MKNYTYENFATFGSLEENSVHENVKIAYKMDTNGDFVFHDVQPCLTVKGSEEVVVYKTSQEPISCSKRIHELVNVVEEHLFSPRP